MQKMYKGITNSPESFIKEKLTVDNTILYIADNSILPEIPNLLIIGDGERAETVLVLSKREDKGLNIQRAFEGNAKEWEKGTTVARNFTNYDYQTLIDNINELDKNKANASDMKTKLSQLTDDSSHRLVTDTEKTKWNNKVDKIDGKGLSSNDYTNEDKAEVAKIKNKINTTDLGSVELSRDGGASKWSDSKKRQLAYFLQDFHERTKELRENKADKIELYKKVNKSDLITQLSQLTDDSSHRTVTDSEKAKWNKITDKADKTEIKTKLSQLIEDSSHRLVTDSEKAKWNTNGGIISISGDKFYAIKFIKTNSVIVSCRDTSRWGNLGYLPVGFRPSEQLQAVKNGGSSIENKENSKPKR